ncbi:MAG: hypothetical protein KGJ23_12510 [Euryarchaeota archaeon]|nr:hypothetical protein [Euryarchaeota archaeon]MDE1837420.1 hypothetical protein [Euryarchaeota archaeon]MDE1879897.1 hypothetical protein [Euryarchaeota archaeon]MDE2045480.1 hypothetical protein [Thermoplasmata archaeon]
MKLEKIGSLELIYADVDEELEYEEGGIMYGTLRGKMDAGSLKGSMHATNHARLRPDGTFLPTLRGILTSAKGSRSFFTMDGISVRDPKADPPRRIVTTGLTFWSPDEELRPWNNVYLVAELKGGKMGESWGVAGAVFRCVPEL